MTKLALQSKLVKLFLPHRSVFKDQKINGREDRIRTCDPLVPNQVLYQAELLPVINGAP